MPSSNINRAAAPLAITMGDPAGVGPEIVAAAWSARQTRTLPPFFWLGDPEVLSGVPFKIIDTPDQANDLFDTALPVLPNLLAHAVTPGTPIAANAPAVLAALKESAALCLAGSASGVVTAPIAKDILYDAGMGAPGQTEYYADACGVPREACVMMLAAPALRVVPVTIHVPLANVPRRLSQELITSRVRVTYHALKQDFGIERPRLAVTGLNPHAGETGALGREEIEIITPALDTLRAQGINVIGPMPADAMFHAEARAHYDAAIAMYHDQALIPLKTLDFHGGVNITLGLPIVRTSPDHGTAFDIAGQGQANPASMIAAIQMAGEIAARRAAHG